MTTPQTSDASAYIPGVCNINRAEIARRRSVGYIGLVLFVVLLVALLALPLSRWFRIALFIPAFIAAIGFLQAKNKFCVGYGAAGMQHASDGDPAALTVDDTAALTKDKQKTRRINTQAAVYAVLATVLALILPHV